jgi:endoribonuclease Dicer
MSLLLLRPDPGRRLSGQSYAIPVDDHNEHTRNASYIHSILLMKWITARHSTLEKKIVFLVPKVALVEQQASFIVKQTPLRVSRFYGATAIDMTNRQEWKDQFDNSDVLVMTGMYSLTLFSYTSLICFKAQIFLNIITHSHWSLDKVSRCVWYLCLINLK